MSDWGVPTDRQGFVVEVIAGAGAINLEAVVTLAGGQVGARAGWSDPDSAINRLNKHGTFLLDARGVSPDQFGDALERVADAVSAIGCPLVVLFDQQAIDPIAAVLMDVDSVLLCEPDLAEQVTALALAGARSGTAARGVREDEAERLRRLNEEVARIAEVLARLTTTADGATSALGDRRPGYDAGANPEQVDVDPQTVRRLIRARRLRETFFPAGLFEDPAWDMLLDLHAAELEGIKVSVSSLCIAAAVAPTTALRWIGRMTDLGLLQRKPDPSDRRRAFLAMSAPARNGMHNYFAAAARAGLPIA